MEHHSKGLVSTPALGRHVDKLSPLMEPNEQDRGILTNLRSHHQVPRYKT